MITLCACEVQTSAHPPGGVWSVVYHHAHTHNTHTQHTHVTHATQHFNPYHTHTPHCSRLSTFMADKTNDAGGEEVEDPAVESTAKQKSGPLLSLLGASYCYCVNC